MNPISHTVEDYLKTIYELQEDMGKVSTNALAERLGVKAGSVTGMIQKLAEDRPRLVDYEKHRGVTLTPAGRKIALEIVRHHRLIELYLHQALGYGWDEVDAEAEKLEHVISEDFEDRIAAILGNPKRDPHGDPIPNKDGSIADLCGEPLSNLVAGQKVKVARVRDDDPALLRYLAEIGIVLDATLFITDKAPFDGPLHVRVGGKSDSPAHALGKQVTDNVYVELK
ncbi:MAG TPA: metal-dependent transcriptional regulator [Anaerolineales bacterium]|nr:metal-dependent transcriptional regulator [Anaerolineales bacterium]HLF00614.1 metal-dependent transcriptional regulator [Anaerolineales bacterium]